MGIHFSRRSGRSAGSRPLLEALEGRDYLSLVPTITSVLPASLVAGRRTTASVTVNLMNTGATAIKGKYTLTLFVDLGTTLDGAQTQINVPVNETLPSLTTGKSAKVTVQLKTVPNVANGDYHILAQITGAAADGGGDLAASAGTVPIAAPFIDLTDSIALTKPASRLVVAGQSFSYSVTITNHGNVAADGKMLVKISDSLNADGSSPTTVLAGSETPNLAPGASKTYTLTQKVPATFDPGIYYLVAEVDPGNTFDESNTGNNTAVTLQTLTVVSPLPDVVGSFTLISTVTKGPDKQEQDITALDITGEDGAGNLTGTATIDNDPWSFSGKITAAGKVSMVLQSGDQISRFALILNKKTLVLTGTFAVNNHDSGTFQPRTLPGRLLNTYTGTQTIDATTTDLVIAVTADEPALGEVTVSVTSVLGDDLAASGTYSEATGQFNIAATVPNGGTPYTISFVGVEIDGVLTGTVTYNTGDFPSGTFTATDGG